jgi:hypothetical protein
MLIYLNHTKIDIVKNTVALGRDNGNIGSETINDWPRRAANVHSRELEVLWGKQKSSFFKTILAAILDLTNIIVFKDSADKVGSRLPREVEICFLRDVRSYLIFSNYCILRKL